MEDKDRIKIKTENLKTHPKIRANVLSRFFFCWQLRFFIKRWRKDFTEEDLYKSIEEHSSKRLGDRLEKLWLEEEHFQKQPSLLRALVKFFIWEFLGYGICFVPVHVGTCLLQSWFLKRLLNFYSSERTETKIQNAYIDASILVSLFLIRVISLSWFQLQQSTLGMKARVACSSLIYRKSLQAKKSDFQKFTTGQIINLLSNDVSRFDFVFGASQAFWITPILLISCIVYLDLEFGHAGLSGSSALLLSLIILLFSGSRLKLLRRQIAEKTDFRIRLIDNIVTGIQAVKMYAWEKSFAKIVQTSRESELKKVTTANLIRMTNTAVQTYESRLCVWLSVIVAILTGVSISPEYVFSLYCIYVTGRTVINFLPNAISYLYEARVSVQRIEKFLLQNYESGKTFSKKCGKKKEDCILREKRNFCDKPPGICIENVSAKWNPESKIYTLSDINFHTKLGELVVLIGPAGSGKSTLLQLILKEINPVKGYLDVKGTISYSSQDSWIFSASVKQNILFGQKFDLERYEKVITVCGLRPDFSVLPYGDQTFVGERGVMLSGGQKARINLARSIYKDSDIYLLDDPLSAVDPQVAKQIFDNCILNHLKDKCVVLVTHQFQYLREVDRIYVVKNGKIETCQSFDKFEVAEYEHTVDTLKATNCDLPSEVKEHRSTGSNDKKIYKSYCLAAGKWKRTFFTLFFLFFAQVVGLLSDYFLTFWVNLLQQEYELNVGLKKFLTRDNCLYIYSAFMTVLIFLNHASIYSAVFFCMKASKTLYNNMAMKVLQATMTFFNYHSSGRILNRFCKDTGSLDEVVPLFLINVVTFFLTTFCIMVTIVLLNFWMSIPTLLGIAMLAFYGIVFYPTHRNLKRTESVTRSSILTHVTSTMQGLTTVKALNAQKLLEEEFDNHQDVHSSAYYTFISLFAAFGFWTELTCSIYGGIVTFSFFLLPVTNAGAVGLAITQSMTLMAMVQFGMKNLGDLQAHMTSVERMVEYSELEPEADDGKLTLLQTWPSTGNLVFENVNLRYSNVAPVLKNVSFKVKSGEKIGIVGRTGAGKTSLISTLFRLYPFEGKIMIDDIDTKFVPLHELRSKISIIPQDPVLFLGNIRENLDPLNQTDDHQLWNALNEVGLKQTISDLPSGLDTPVTERGTNFSVGQRQLLCLARTMLRNTRIVVLDEATANVDLKTDELIQSTIRKKFESCTVLTIAHRMNTVVDSDKILVMDNGEVVEFGDPYELIQNPNGVFYKYVQDSGDALIKELIRMSDVLVTRGSTDVTLQVSEMKPTEKLI